MSYSFILFVFDSNTNHITPSPYPKAVPTGNWYYVCIIRYLSILKSSDDNVTYRKIDQTNTQIQCMYSFFFVDINTNYISQHSHRKIDQTSTQIQCIYSSFLSASIQIIYHTITILPSCSYYTVWRSRPRPRQIELRAWLTVFYWLRYKRPSPTFPVAGPWKKALTKKKASPKKKVATKKKAVPKKKYRREVLFGFRGGGSIINQQHTCISWCCHVFWRT